MSRLPGRRDGHQDLCTPGTRGSRPFVEVSPDRPTFPADGSSVNSRVTCRDSDAVDEVLAGNYAATCYPGGETNYAAARYPLYAARLPL